MRLLGITEESSLWHVRVVDEVYTGFNSLGTLYWYGHSSYAGCIASWLAPVEDHMPYTQRLSGIVPTEYYAWK